MAELVDVFVEIARGAIPYLVVGNKVHPVIAFVLLPLVMFAVSQVKKYLMRVKTADGYTLVVGSHLTVGDRSFHNDEYTRVIWYLKEQFNPKNCVFVNNYAGMVYGDSRSDLGDTMAWYDIFKIDGEIVIVYKNESMRIKSSSETLDKSKITYLYLTARTSNIINDFVRSASNAYMEEFEKRLVARKKKVRAVYTNNEDAWVMKPLKIKKTFRNVFLPTHIREQIIHDLDEFKNGRADYEERGNAYKRGYLLYGPPGTGKTSTYYAIAEYLQTDIYIMSLAGMKEVKTYNKLVDAIQPGSVVVIDDVDRVSLTNKAEVAKPDDKPTKVVDVSTYITLQNLLDTFDGYNSLYGCVVVFTTNYKDKLDEALIRPGRIDVQILLDVPKSEVIREIFQSYYGRDIAAVIPRDQLDHNKISVAGIINRFILPHRQHFAAAADAFNRELNA